REIVVLGTVQGNIETREKIEISKEAKVVGDIRTARIVIEDGAYFKGSIDIVRAEAPKPAAVPKPPPVQVTSSGSRSRTVRRIRDATKSRSGPVLRVARSTAGDVDSGLRRGQP